MDIKLLNSIKKILNAVDGADKEEITSLVSALDTDDKLLLENSDKITRLESDALAFDGIDVAKTKAVFDMLKENGLEDTSKILDLVKKGNATESEHNAFRDTIESLKKEGELKDAKNLSDLLNRDTIASLMSNSTFGKEMPASSITTILTNSESLRKENGVIQLKDKTGNWWALDSKEGKGFIDESYSDINPKPNTGTDLEERNSSSLQKTENLSAGQGFASFAASI